ncbi:MAG: phosphatase PAP2 family protein [Cyclobacteriaceae bacterium]
MEQWFDSILQLDEELFSFLNSLNAPILDTLMLWATNKYFWTPLYLLLIFFISKEYKWSGIYLIVTIILVVVLANEVTSSFMKPYFQRLRPCYDSDLQETIHLIKRCGGRFGFASSHASNHFGLATIVWLLFGTRYRITALLFPWAALIAYSRVYIGVHYPLDILVGALVGGIVGWIVFKLFKLVNGKYHWIPALRTTTKSSAYP